MNQGMRWGEVKDASAGEARDDDALHITHTTVSFVQQQLRDTRMREIETTPTHLFTQTHPPSSVVVVAVQFHHLVEFPSEPASAR